ncbi:MAG: hypothetical protein IT208_05380 [Chthonomonadales bacterium]|nr:hypothetical protein [Chthonomonadales bacterium]
MQLRLETSEAPTEGRWRSEPAQEAPEDLRSARSTLALTLRAVAARLQRTEQDRAAVEHWATELRRETRAYRRWRWRARVRAAYRIALWGAFVYLMITGGIRHFPFWFLFLGGGAAVDAAAGSRKQAASNLAKTEDKRAAGVLALAYRDGDGATREVAARGLTNLLPRFRSSDRHLLGDDGMAALIGILGATVRDGGSDLRRAVDLRIVILTALEQVGDARAIPAVRRLQGMPLTVSAIARAFDSLHVQVPVRQEYARLQRAAADCLRALEQNAEAERLRSVLLRPASSPNGAGDSLLRPAAAGDRTPPERLLRPAAHEAPEASA